MPRPTIWAKPPDALKLCREQINEMLWYLAKVTGQTSEAVFDRACQDAGLEAGKPVEIVCAVRAQRNQLWAALKAAMEHHAKA